MDKLRDPRVRLQLEVKVWGLSASGAPFNHAARTVEIGALGARLSGVPGVKENDVIGIQYGNLKARFRVVWVGTGASGQQGLIGVECVEPGKCIWTEALESAESAANPSALAAAIVPSESDSPNTAQTGHDRRRYPRYPCAGTITLTTKTAEGLLTSLRLADVSLGGCYGETLSPLPIGSNVELTLKAVGLEIAAKAVVRTCHSSMGNGFAFAQFDPDEWKKLVGLVQRLGEGKVVSGAGIDSGSDAELIEGLEAVIAVLQRKGVLSREEVINELRRRRAAR